MDAGFMAEGPLNKRHLAQYVDQLRPLVTDGISWYQLTDFKKPVLAP